MQKKKNFAISKRVELFLKKEKTWKVFSVRMLESLLFVFYRHRVAAFRILSGVTPHVEWLFFAKMHAQICLQTHFLFNYSAIVQKTWDKKLNKWKIWKNIHWAWEKICAKAKIHTNKNDKLEKNLLQHFLSRLKMLRHWSGKYDAIKVFIFTEHLPFITWSDVFQQLACWYYMKR